VLQLPAKRRQRIPLDVKVTSEAMKQLSELKDTLRNSDRGDFEGLKALSAMYPTTAAAKVVPVRNYLAEVFESSNGNVSEKFIIFGHHSVMLDAVEKLCVRKTINYIRIDGQTPLRARAEFVSKFQNDQNIRVAILSMTAAGQGLTLTAASTVIFAELHWTPGVIQQAEDRAHRIGQKNAVNCIFLIGKNTLDDIMWPLIARKVRVLGFALDGKKASLNAKSKRLAQQPAAHNTHAEHTIVTESASGEGKVTKEIAIVKGDVRWFLNGNQRRSASTGWTCEICSTKHRSRAILTCMSCHHPRPRTPRQTAKSKSDGSIVDPITIDDTGGTHSTPQKTANSEASPSQFRFFVSKATGRVFVHNAAGCYLQQNFSEMDIRLQNDPAVSASLWAELQTFWMSWSKLRVVEQNMLSNTVLTLPLHHEVQKFKLLRKGGGTPSVLRYSQNCSAPLTAETPQAQRIESFFSATPSEVNNCDKAQPTSATGCESKRPLCNLCHEPMPESKCVAEWQSQFCSFECFQRKAIRLSSGAIRRQLFDMERGVCQLCGLDAHSLFKSVSNNSVLDPCS